MRRIRLLIMSVSILMFTGLTLSTLHAQATTFQKNQQGNNHVSGLTTKSLNSLGDTEIIPGTVTSTSEEALMYIKPKLEEYKGGRSSVEKTIGYLFYTDLANYISEHSGHNGSVAAGIIEAYTRVRAKIDDKFDSSYVLFLNNLADQTVRDLQ